MVRIFATGCAGLRLDEASWYAALVNAASVEVPALLRVRPDDPDASYLIQKLEGHAARHWAPDRWPHRRSADLKRDPCRAVD